MLKIIFHGFLFLVLTILSQSGGLAYLAALAVAKVVRVDRLVLKLVIFALLYAGMGYAASLIAPAFGRVPLSCVIGSASRLVVQSPLYCALNRNYVTPELQRLAEGLASHMDQSFPGTVTMVLDANFPFLDGFPLLPHLSHADGKKLDFTFYYQDAEGRFLNGATRSPIGYFAFEQPTASDEQPCVGRKDWLTTRWDLAFLQPFFPVYRLDVERTRAAVSWLVRDGVASFGVEKVFLEPHLRRALGVSGPAMRFQGCRAARHDDHIHVQIK